MTKPIQNLRQFEFDIYVKAWYSVCKNCATLQRLADNKSNVCMWCGNSIISINSAVEDGLILVRSI
jgi:rRNA maturation endonuclease Nob1